MNYPNIIEEHNNLEQRFDNFIQNQLVNLIYPIGSIYMSVNNVSPSTFLGGTWEQIKDTFLLCSGSKYGAGSTGGEAKHTLTVNEMPSHNHNNSVALETTGSTTLQTSAIMYRNQKQTTSFLGNLATAATGSGAAHNNMQPYIALNYIISTGK